MTLVSTVLVLLPQLCLALCTNGGLAVQRTGTATHASASISQPSIQLKSGAGDAAARNQDCQTAPAP